MTNPYREHSDHIQSLMRRMQREYMYTTLPDPELMATDSIYPTSYVVGSASGDFEIDLEQRLEDLMKGLTDEKPNSEDM